MSDIADFKTILCPTDFSEGSDRAVEYALDMAKVFGARVRLLHVFQLPFFVGFEDGAAAAAASTQFFDEMRGQASTRLEEMEKKAEAGGIEADTEVVEGAPHKAIVDASEKADLVVMGTHGRSGLPRLVLGSVAERVVRLAACPVLTVPPPSDD